MIFSLDDGPRHNIMMLATPKNGEKPRKMQEACGGVACVWIIGPSNIRISS